MRGAGLRQAIALIALSAALGACNSSPAPSVAEAVAIPEPPAPGVVAAIGSSLDEKDRAAAIAAQQDAVSGGARKTWRGAHGAYGFVTPGAESGGCRDYTHKIFINGRPQEAKGQACRRGDAWRVNS